jgi:hypothetical protein
VILDIFSVTLAVTFLALLATATVLTIVQEDDPDHYYDEELA